jgi:hypothetical protein
MKARYARQTLATHTGRSKEAKWGPTSGAQISQAESFHEVSLRCLEGLTGTILRDVLILVGEARWKRLETNMIAGPAWMLECCSYSELAFVGCSPCQVPTALRKLSVLNIRKGFPRIGSSCNTLSAPEPLASRTMKQLGVTPANQGGGKHGYGTSIN